MPLPPHMRKYEEEEREEPVPRERPLPPHLRHAEPHEGITHEDLADLIDIKFDRILKELELLRKRVE